jgi:phenylpropionate dioxygenase-like ring-hydroxylating dioxygenase large terminal subunit
MFLHQQQIQYQLRHDQYFGAEQHRREIELLFLPAWHLVGTKTDLPRDGDFRTMDIVGQPVQIRNSKGEYHAFLNVCSHRNCLLTHEECGNSPTLRCQYHGWEYEASGRTRKIPDAGCFSPFDRERARLYKFRLETCGELLYVSLVEDGPSLREFLGPYFAIAEQRFQPPWRQNWAWQYDYPCNWKLAIENTLESYHLPCLHKKTFTGVYPSEAATTHDLDSAFTMLRYDLREDARVTKAQRWFVKRLGGTSTDVYTHHHVHPHLVFVASDLYVHAQIYLPTSPTTCRTMIRMYSYRGSRRNPLARLFGTLIALQGARLNRMVQMEDAAVFRDQQRGIEAARHRGCIGTREERLYYFQRFVADRTPTASPDSD